MALVEVWVICPLYSGLTPLGGQVSHLCQTLPCKWHIVLHALESLQWGSVVSVVESMDFFVNVEV